MLRIANFCENRLGRDDGNPLYVQACFKRMQYYTAKLAGAGEDSKLKAWLADGKDDPRAEKSAKELWEKEHQLMEVDLIAPTGDISPYGTYDLNLHIDWGEDALTGVLPYKPRDTPHPFAYWASDTHLGYEHRLSVAKKADFVFCAQKRAVEEMKRDGVPNPIWLPHAVEPQAYPKFDLASKKYDVCFVGHVNSQNREDGLDRLFKEFPNFYYGQQLFDAAARRYAETKVVFNMSMLDDLIMRVFEVMGSGSFLLTNWIPTIEELFEDGKHLVLYRSLDEMVDKVNYYLKHNDEREKIAQAGYEEVMAKHTFQHRVDVILSEFMKSRKPVLA